MHLKQPRQQTPKQQQQQNMHILLFIIMDNRIILEYPKIF